MKRILLTTLFALAVTAAAAQQTIKSETMSAFDVINLSGELRVELIPAERNSIEILLKDSDINRFKWGVTNTTLAVSLTQGGQSRGSADIKIYYAGPLKEITMAGGELSTGGGLKAEVLKVQLKSGAKMTAGMDVFDLELYVNSNSVAELTGKVKYLLVNATERSKANTLEMAALSAEVDAATGAEVFVNAEERLVVNAKTTATIFYRGSPILKDNSSRMSTGVMGSSVQRIGN